jgi:uncharacterized damage-inducible protein DinB
MKPWMLVLTAVFGLSAAGTAGTGGEQPRTLTARALRHRGRPGSHPFLRLWRLFAANFDWCAPPRRRICPGAGIRSTNREQTVDTSVDALEKGGMHMPETIDQFKAQAESAKRRLLSTFSHVPDDKLTWQPAPTAKSALQIVAHAALSYRHFVVMLNGDPLPDGDRDALMAMEEAAEQAINTRELALQAVEEGFAATIAALDRLTPERMSATVETPFASMPVSFIATLPARHVDNHAAQIDYLQTMWGDFGFYMS